MDKEAKTKYGRNPDFVDPDPPGRPLLAPPVHSDEDPEGDPDEDPEGDPEGDPA